LRISRRMSVRRRKEERWIRYVWDDAKTRLQAVALNGALQCAADRENDVGPTERQPRFAHVEATKRGSGKGGEVFGQGNGNTLNLAEDDSRQRSVVNVDMDQIGLKPLIGPLPDGPKGAVEIGEIRDPRKRCGPVPYPIGGDTLAQSLVGFLLQPAERLEGE